MDASISGIRRDLKLYDTNVRLNYTYYNEIFFLA